MTYLEWQQIIRRTPNSQFYPDPLVRNQPDSVNVPENLGVSALNDLVGNTSLIFLHRTTGNTIDIENQVTLTSVSFPNLNAPGATITIKNNAALASLSVPNIGVPTGTSGASLHLDFSGNALNAADVDALYNRLALSLSSGHAYYCTINTSGGTNAAPTAASSLARGNTMLTNASYHITVTTN